MNKNIKRKNSPAFSFRGKGKIQVFLDKVSNIYWEQTLWQMMWETWMSHGPHSPRASLPGGKIRGEYMRRFSKIKYPSTPSMEFTGGKSTVDWGGQGNPQGRGGCWAVHEDKVRSEYDGEPVLFCLEFHWRADRGRESQVLLYCLYWLPGQLFPLIDSTLWAHDQRKHSQCTAHLKLWIIQELFQFVFGRYHVCMFSFFYQQI